MIRWLVSDLTGDLAAEDGVLVPEHEQFGILGGVMAQQHRRDGRLVGKVAIGDLSPANLKSIVADIEHTASSIGTLPNSAALGLPDQLDHPRLQRGRGRLAGDGTVAKPDNELTMRDDFSSDTGSSEDSAANQSRSAGSYRTLLVIWRRRTAFSCRSTSSSASLAVSWRSSTAGTDSSRRVSWYSSDTITGS
jgi:hypothetical protein